ncbi:MAG TPA: glycosyltransferase [Stellaceae bacterium]|nr:glycosyltransferase [Stellaceae bacterium]
MADKIAIVMPVLDDWESFTALVHEISETFTGSDLDFHICAIDDGSTTPFDSATLDLTPGSCVGSIAIIRLAANLGHQRAIAIGLCAIAETGDADRVLVMDSDGQDRPADIATLLSMSRRQPRHVVFAARAERAEPRMFRFWYGLYRLLFHGLTGQAINFGNFCAMPMAAVRRLVHMPELWNHLAASVMRSRLPYTSVPTARGRRTSGRSRMNLVALIAHGFSAMSVYTDQIFIRVLLAAGLVAGLAGLAIAAAVTIRVATHLAIPGWATTAIGDLLIMLLETLVVMVASSLTMLARRSLRPILPIADCRCFVAGREEFRFGSRQAIVAAVRPAA